ncbi:putative ribonuclease H-like domain-containing protein [Tanacetum coccineum]|uniref:Ribonuclease H-like domain-containing protein n=1 Tax=Tanacetum coccineum TaxID=301880 RepID=A0ABQ5BK81_9ASTR
MGTYSFITARVLIYLKNMVGYKMGYFKGMSYDEIRPMFEKEYNKIQTLFKKDTEVEKTKTKRVAEETLLQESFKKLRTAEASSSEPIQEQPIEEPKELSEEELKKMLEIVPVEEIKAEALQVKSVLMGSTVYTVEKALYGLHQAPRAWVKGDILLVQVYVDDIIFGSTKKELCTEFEKCMHKRFQMSSMGELTFFLGLQVMQKEDGILVSQDKYVDEILKKFGFSTVKTVSTHMKTSKPLMKDENAEDVDVHLYRSMIGSLMYLTSSRPDIMFVYPKDSPFDLEAYTNSDYASASLDRKSTIKGCQFLGSRLISWQCKKQIVVSNSTTEAEYVVAANCCGQVLWIQNQMLDYGYNFMNTKIFIDNESTICIVKNPVFHSKTKHIEIRHHFI